MMSSACVPGTSVELKRHRRTAHAFAVDDLRAADGAPTPRESARTDAFCVVQIDVAVVELAA